MGHISLLCRFLCGQGSTLTGKAAHPWAGLGWVGLGWAGLGRAGRPWQGSVAVGQGGTPFGWAGHSDIRVLGHCVFGRVFLA